jgi:uncharacterized protein YciI
MMLVNCSDPMQFAAADPYVLNGLVKRYWVRAWTTVVGKDAQMPVMAS